MPRTTPPRSSDARRTVTPDGALILLEFDGFTVSLDAEVIVRVIWRKVAKVFAYTRFIGKDMHLCLLFELKGRFRDHVVVNEKVIGWHELKQTLVTSLGSVTLEWETKAGCNEACRRASEPVSRVVPMHTVNPVQVWPLERGHVQQALRCGRTVASPPARTRLI